MTKHFAIFLLMIFISYITTQDNNSPECNNDTCPSNRGICYNNKCLCLSQFATLNTGSNKSCDLFCQYEKISRWIPILLEIFLPGLGNYAYGRKFLALTKAGIILIPFLLLGLGVLIKSQELRGIFREVFRYIIASAVIIFVILEACDIIFYGIGWYVDQNGIPFL